MATDYDFHGAGVEISSLGRPVPGAATSRKNALTGLAETGFVVNCVQSAVENDNSASLARKGLEV